MENTEALNIRISKELKQTLDKQAQQKNQTISDYVRELLTKHVLQDSDYVSGISPDLLNAISIEAKRRGISTKDLITKLIVMGFGRLRKAGSPNVFVLD